MFLMLVSGWWCCRCSVVSLGFLVYYGKVGCYACFEQVSGGDVSDGYDSLCWLSEFCVYVLYYGISGVEGSKGFFEVFSEVFW